MTGSTTVVSPQGLEAAVASPSKNGNGVNGKSDLAQVMNGIGNRPEGAVDIPDAMALPHPVDNSLENNLRGYLQHIVDIAARIGVDVTADPNYRRLVRAAQEFNHYFIEKRKDTKPINDSPRLYEQSQELKI